jgi:hypothetical protein
MFSVLAEPPRYSGGRSMRAVETTPPASLNAETGKELSSALVWPVSLVSRFTHPWPSSPTADEFHFEREK